MGWTAQAEVLVDTTGIGADGAMMCGRCRATGLDVRSFSPLIGATLALGVRPLSGAGWSPWSADRELVDALLDLVALVAARYTECIGFIGEAVATRAAAYKRIAALDPEENADDIRWLRVNIANCSTALEVIAPLPARLRAAMARLNAAPGRLGDTYAAVYRLVEAGRVLPYDGRWITGEEPTT